MRQIKFRAKPVDDDEWIYGGGVIVIDDEQCILFSHENGFPHLTKVKENTVCQFSGLYDVSNNEVYEHDVVEASGMPNSPIEFVSGQFHPVYDDGSGDMWEGPVHAYNIRVIGNKLENPNLVEVQ